MLRLAIVVSQAALVVTALLVLAMSHSVLRHSILVSYGLELPRTAAFALGALFLLLALSGMALALRFPRSPAWALGLSVLTLPVCALLAFFSIMSIRALEVTYTKGESNLGRLAAYSSSLATWEARAASVQAGIVEAAGLSPLPARNPLNPVIHSKRELNGYSVENVFMETVPGFFLTGNLYRPARGEVEQRMPAVLVPQGHFRNGRFNDDTQYLAATCARMGAVVFTYDMVGRGEIGHPQHHDPNALSLQLWNSIRVVDFVSGLPDVDPSRIGMTGASGGGTQTFLCAAIEPRVSVLAPVVMVSSWVYGGCECESGLPIHRSAPGLKTNNAEIAAMAAPRPQLIVSVGTDWTHTVPTREFPFIRRVYRLFDKEDLVENAHFEDDPHDFGFSKRDAVYRFLAEHLELSLAKVLGANDTIDESPSAIESPETMRAVTDSHPLPDHSVSTWDAIMNSLAIQQGATPHS